MFGISARMGGGGGHPGGGGGAQPPVGAVLPAQTRPVVWCCLT